MPDAVLAADYRAATAALERAEPLAKWVGQPWAVYPLVLLLFCMNLFLPDRYSLWWIAMLLAVGGGLIWVNGRHGVAVAARVGDLLAARSSPDGRLPRCLVCRYDLRGTPGDVCTECGEPVHVPPPHELARRGEPPKLPHPDLAGFGPHEAAGLWEVARRRVVTREYLGGRVAIPAILAMPLVWLAGWAISSAALAMGQPEPHVYAILILATILGGLAAAVAVFLGVGTWLLNRRARRLLEPTIRAGRASWCWLCAEPLAESDNACRACGAARAGSSSPA